MSLELSQSSQQSSVLSIIYFVYSFSFHILAVTETWFSPSILDREVLPSNFAVYRHDRLTCGGGVLLAVHHSIPSRLLSSPSHLEIVSVEIGLISPLLFCVIYIPSNSSSDYCSEILQYIESIVSHPRVLFAEDINFPDICWSSLCGQFPQSDAFCELILRHSLVQVVDFHTHLRGGVLDLVLSNSDGLVENILTFSPKFLRSDHYFCLLLSRVLAREYLSNLNCLILSTSRKLTLRVYPPFYWTLILVRYFPPMTSKLVRS